MATAGSLQGKISDVELGKRNCPLAKVDDCAEGLHERTWKSALVFFLVFLLGGARH